MILFLCGTVHVLLLLVENILVKVFVRGPFFLLLDHVLSFGGVTLLGPGCVWGVASGTQHWAMWSNGYQRTFKPTKPLKPKYKNHDNV